MTYKKTKLEIAVDRLLILYFVIKIPTMIFLVMGGYL